MVDYSNEFTTLAQAGFQPKRYGWFVRIGRRILWPLIRPFTQHVYHEVLQLRQELRRDMAAVQTKQEDLFRFQQELVDLRSQLQDVASDLGGKLHFAIDHLETTRSLYGHLADEMPKFVQPVLDMQAGLAELAQRCGAVEAKFLDADQSAEIQALQTRQMNAERAVSELKADIASHGNILAEVALTQSELRDRIDGSGTLVTAELEQLNRRQADFEGRLADIADQSGSVTARLDSDLTALLNRQSLLESSATSRSNVDLELLSQKVMELTDQLVELDHVSHLTRSLQAQVDALPRDLTATVQEALQNLRHETEDLRNHVGAIANQTPAFPASDGTTLVNRVQGFEDTVARLNSVLDQAAQKEAALSSELQQIHGNIVEIARRSDHAAAEAMSALNKAEEISKPHLIVCSANDGLAILQSGDLIAQEVQKSGSWDKHIVDLMDDVVRSRSDLAVDIGAHFGILTMAMARRFKAVHSFEPNDFSFKLLSANVGINCLSNVTVHNYPLFSREEKLSLGVQRYQELPLPLDEDGSFDPFKAHNIGSMTFATEGTGLFSHDARPLDSLQLDAVSFIKIDCQGADGEVLMGAMQTIERCRPVVVFEWEAHLAANFSVSLELIKDRLKGIGYSVGILKRHNEKQADYVAYPVN